MATIIGIVIVLGAIGFVGVCVARRRRTPFDVPVLPDDWWPSFERDFRAYARRVTRPQRDGSRRQGGRGPTGR